MNGRDDFSKIPNGGPGVENRLALVHTGGVLAGRISLNRMVDLLSTSPAKLFGLFPKKGTIAVGSDADLVVFDPSRTWTISAGSQVTRADYNPYEGRQVTGIVETVLSRGQLVVDGGRVVGRPGHGRFLARAGHGRPLVATAPSQVNVG
jgi:dihydropyrimidinase